MSQNYDKISVKILSFKDIPLSQDNNFFLENTIHSFGRYLSCKDSYNNRTREGESYPKGMAMNWIYIGNHFRNVSREMVRCK